MDRRSSVCAPIIVYVNEKSRNSDSRRGATLHSWSDETPAAHRRLDRRLVGWDGRNDSMLAETIRCRRFHCIEAL
jgi:hypothetical protein